MEASVDSHGEQDENESREKEEKTDHICFGPYRSEGAFLFALVYLFGALLLPEQRRQKRCRSDGNDDCPELLSSETTAEDRNLTHSISPMSIISMERFHV